MKNLVSTGVAAIALGLAAQAQAASFEIIGSTAANENSCLSPVPFFIGDDCSYDASNPTGAASQWAGPYIGNGYYVANPGANLGDPANRAGIPISGILTIDGAGPGALISMTFTMGPAFRQYDTGTVGLAVETWDSITHTVAPSAAAAAANDLGGFTYTLGIIPGLIVDNGTGESFPSSGVGFGTNGNWAAPGSAGIATYEGNTGTASTAAIAGYQCLLNCDTSVAWNSDARAAFGNILMSITTDAEGNLVDGFAFLVDEMALLTGLLGPNPNSFQATTMNFTVVPVPAAAWLFISALGLMGWIRRRAA